jgi:hypothetical protein
MGWNESCLNISSNSTKKVYIGTTRFNGGLKITGPIVMGKESKHQCCIYVKDAVLNMVLIMK